MQGRVPPGKASRLLPKSGHRPVMRLVEDSLPIPSGVGTNKESRKQLPAEIRDFQIRMQGKIRLFFEMTKLPTRRKLPNQHQARQYRSAFFGVPQTRTERTYQPPKESRAFLHVGRRYRLEGKIRTSFFHSTLAPIPIV